jgi:hypothetical protein
MDWIAISSVAQALIQLAALILAWLQFNRFRKERIDRMVENVMSYLENKQKGIYYEGLSELRGDKARRDIRRILLEGFDE